MLKINFESFNKRKKKLTLIFPKIILHNYFMFTSQTVKNKYTLGEITLKKIYVMVKIKIRF